MLDGRSRRRPGDGHARILVSRPDHLGDFLLTLPAIGRLRRLLPDARITCMVAPSLRPIAERAIDVDEVLAMPLLMSDPPPRSASRARGVAGALRGRFDLALLPRPSDPWSGSLAAAASIPLRVGHRQPATLPFLTHAFPENLSRHVASEAVALAERAAALLGGRADGPVDAPVSTLRLLPEDHAGARDLLRTLGADDPPPVVVHPTAGWVLKSWPVERWRRLVAGISDRLRTSVLVIGEPPDRPHLDAIATGAGGTVHVVDAVSLPTLAALHAAARLVVGMDSGALHLAGAVGAPVVGLFGPFGPARVAPVVPAGRVRSVWRSLPCSPCGTLVSPPCGATRDPACLLAIPADDVLRAAVASVLRPHPAVPKVARPAGR